MIINGVRKIKKFQSGFFSVELLVVLFLAAAFVVTGYQLYSSVLDASSKGKSDIAASNLANDYLEMYRYSATTPCVEKTVIDSLPVESEILRDVSATVKITCPTTGVTSFLKNGVSSKVESIISYDGGRKTSTSKIVNNKVKIKQISAGGGHVLALSSDGFIYSWGSNSGGQLGGGPSVGSSSSTSIAVDTSGALANKRVVQISAGSSHSLALDSDGLVYSWGVNSTGSLGNGTSSNSYVPVVISKSGILAGKKVIQISAGGMHSLALDSNGSIYSWGNNLQGQLGDSTNSNRYTPIMIKKAGVLEGKSIIGVSAGGLHSLALDSNGSAYSWGINSSGQLGEGSTVYRINTPTEVDKSGVLSGKKITQISAGEYYSIALSSDGFIYSWGANGSGQLGNGSGSNSLVPVGVNRSGVLAGKKVVQISAGSSHSLALGSDGSVYSWGNNAQGQLGNGNTANSNVPVLVDNSGALSGGETIQVSTGVQLNANSSSFSLNSEGRVTSWGRNTVGQLGDGTIISRSVPVSVQNGTTISKLATGYYHTIALMSDGKIFGWGRNSNGGSVGNGSTVTVNFPIEINTTGTPMAGKKIVDIAAGGYHTIALDSENNLYAWGLGTSGQMGDGSKISRNRPVAVSVAGTPLAGKTIVQLSASEFNNAALTSDGKVYTWGRGINGVLGSGDIADLANPKPVEVSVTGTPMAGKVITQVALGSTNNAYAIDNAGTVYSWGCAASGALGNGVTSMTPTTTTCTTGIASKPVSVNTTGTPMAGKKIVEIGAGNTFAVARTESGETFAWGNNSNNRLGDGTATARSKPVKIDVLLKRLTVGYLTGGGIGLDGYMYSWGSNSYYQQNNGGTASVTTPTTISPFTSAAIEQVSTGAYSVLVMDYNKNLYGWGYNTYANLGVANSVTPQKTPRPLTRIQYDNLW